MLGIVPSGFNKVARQPLIARINQLTRISSLRIGKSLRFKNAIQDSNAVKDPITPPKTTPPKTLRAAEYVRMSTEHQQYSTHNQSDRIREYAERRGIEIVRTYADEGKSGLSIGGRAGLQRLIADAESGDADFSLILVYDVSRWGRFQDADESAYYVAVEVMLRRQARCPFSAPFRLPHRT